MCDLSNAIKYIRKTTLIQGEMLGWDDFNVLFSRGILMECILKTIKNIETSKESNIMVKLISDKFKNLWNTQETRPETSPIPHQKKSDRQIIEKVK